MLEPPLVPEPPLPALPAETHQGARRAIAILEVLLCSGLPTQVVIGKLLYAGGLAPRDSTGELTFAFVVSLSLLDTVALIALMAFITRSRGETISELWFNRRPVATEVLLGILLIPLVFAIVATLLGVLRIYAPSLHNVETNPLERLAASSFSNALVFGLVAIFAGGVREELQRAFLLRRFEQHLGGATVGVLVSSVAFGLGHYEQGWDAAIATGALGALWAIVYQRRRSTVAPMVSHAGFNALEILRVAATALRN